MENNNYIEMREQLNNDNIQNQYRSNLPNHLQSNTNQFQQAVNTQNQFQNTTMKMANTPSNIQQQRIQQNQVDNRSQIVREVPNRPPPIPFKDYNGAVNTAASSQPRIQNVVQSNNSHGYRSNLGGGGYNSFSNPYGGLGGYGNSYGGLGGYGNSYGGYGSPYGGYSGIGGFGNNIFGGYGGTPDSFMRRAQEMANPFFTGGSNIVAALHEMSYTADSTLMSIQMLHRTFSTLFTNLNRGREFLQIFTTCFASLSSTHMLFVFLKKILGLFITFKSADQNSLWNSVGSDLPPVPKGYIWTNIMLLSALVTFGSFFIPKLIEFIKNKFNNSIEQDSITIWNINEDPCMVVRVQNDFFAESPGELTIMRGSIVKINMKYHALDENEIRRKNPFWVLVADVNNNKGFVPQTYLSIPKFPLLPTWSKLCDYIKQNIEDREQYGISIPNEQSEEYEMPDCKGEPINRSYSKYIRNLVRIPTNIFSEVSNEEDNFQPIS